MAAYLADEDADVHNITDAAVEEDVRTAALNLTALVAAAVMALAATAGRTPHEARHAIAEDGFGEFSRTPFAAYWPWHLDQEHRRIHRSRYENDTVPEA